MASFAKLNSENIVITVESVVNEVLKDSNGVEQESIGIQFLRTFVTLFIPSPLTRNHSS